MIPDIYSKFSSTSGANNHHDVTNSEADEMV